MRREGAIRWMAVVCLGVLLGSCSASREDPVKKHIAWLEEQVDRLRDVREIKHLQRAWGFYIDKAMWDEAADLFARDATIEFGNEGVYVGQARIREYLMRQGGGRIGLVEGQLNNHLQLQPVVHVASDGRSAKGRWRTLMMLGEYGKWAKCGEGIYE
ncbi:MAG TPA: nuclear transport factor 2 family protein, partial [Steroidobacteraceae bacterium]